MEVIKPFWTFYKLFDRMKTNDENYAHIMSTLKALRELEASIRLKQHDQLPDDLSKALVKLTAILEEAEEVLEKFNKKQVMIQMVKSKEYKLKFDNLTKSFTEAFVALSGALHVHQEKKMAEQEAKLAKQEAKLAEQGAKLQRVQLMLGDKNRGCILQ